MTLAEARAEGTDMLRTSGIDTPGLDATLLLAEVLAVDRSRLLSHGTDPLTPGNREKYRKFIVRRASGECVAYLLGRKEFRGLDFKVSDAVLVPRPETETLVEAALAWLANHPEPVRVLDVCTGSGCVAVAIKNEAPRCDLSAGDVSPAALAVAQENAARLLGPDEGIKFYSGDLLQTIPGSFELIVANPPYVPSAAIDNLAAEVRREPRLALDGGADGLDLIRRLIRESTKKLTAGGRLLIEAGHDQSDSLAALLADSGFTDIQKYPDLSGLFRVTGGTLPDKT